MNSLCEITVNERQYQCDPQKKLMEILRDDLHLTSVKDGCSEGACGSCTVLADGKAVKACLFPAERFRNKKIVTAEGLTAREKEVYTYAFGACGAVQCGFCIPGMVLAAKALLDVNRNPTREMAAHAIRNQICRCTGYQKIIDAIILAADLFRENTKIEPSLITGIGHKDIRIDVKDKVLGTGIYADDICMNGMLYGKAVRSKYPRARVLSIDTAKAKQLEGVVAVVTAKDIPGKNKIGHLKQDWDALIAEGDCTRYLGDSICLVAATTKAILEQAVLLIEVTYEPMQGIFRPSEALLPQSDVLHDGGNILAHEHLIRGDAKTALEQSAYVVSKHYSTPFTEHAFLEPECAVSYVEPLTQKVWIYSSDQGTYDTRRECSTLLGLSPEQVVVKNMLVGGGFGGKEDMTVQHHAALLAWITKRPVKVKLSRAESMLVHPKRHPMEIDLTVGCDKDGYLTGMKAVIVADTGAYASLGGPVLQRACTHAAGPYNYHNIDIEGTAVYTDNPPAGAFRGFGVTQSCFALECSLNLLAKMAHLSPWEIRYRNAIRPGQELPNGQIAAPSTALVQTLEAVRERFEKEPYAGIACAMKNAGVGVGIKDTGRVRLVIKDHKVQIHSGASCIGQGVGTVLTAVICEVTGLTSKQLVYEAPCTEDAPDSGTTSGSRQTLITGEAAKRAAQKLKQAMDLGYQLEDLEGCEYLGEYLAVTDPMGSQKEHPVSHVAYGYATQVAFLDQNGYVKEMLAAHDVGKAINPLSVEGQIEGGVVMSLGYALTEQFPLKEGKPLARFGTLGLLRADRVPKITSMIIEKNPDSLAYGAIGIGEITSIPTAPAVAGAYYRFDHEFRTELPLIHTPYRKESK